MTESNADLIRRAFREVWEDGSFALVAEHYVDHDPAPGLPPDRHGLQLLREATLRAFPDLVVDVEQVVADDDLVAVRLSQRATHSGPFMGVPPPGRTGRWTTMAMFRIEDGKLVERWGVVDGLGLMVQLGMELRPRGGE